MLIDLCDDVQNILLRKLDNISLIMLLNVNKKYNSSIKFNCKALFNLEL